MILVEVEASWVYKGTLDGQIIWSVGVHLVHVRSVGVGMEKVRLVEVVLAIAVWESQRVGKFIVCNVCSTVNVAGRSKLVVDVHAPAHGEIGWVDCTPTFVCRAELRVVKLLVHIETVVVAEAARVELHVFDFLFDIRLR